MIHDLAQPLGCHPDHCDCLDCEMELAAVSQAEEASFIAFLALLGVAVGMLLVGIYDHLIAGPGLGVMIGR